MLGVSHANCRWHFCMFYKAEIYKCFSALKYNTLFPEAGGLVGPEKPELMLNLCNCEWAVPHSEQSLLLAMPGWHLSITASPPARQHLELWAHHQPSARDIWKWTAEEQFIFSPGWFLLKSMGDLSKAGQTLMLSQECWGCTAAFDCWVSWTIRLWNGEQ